MSGAEATILVIFMLWAIVIVCFIVGSLADRRRRRAVVARLERERAEARAQRRAQEPYTWPKHRGHRQEFGTVPTVYQPAVLTTTNRTRSSVIEDVAAANGVILPAMSWDATPPSCEAPSSVSASCD